MLRSRTRWALRFTGIVVSASVLLESGAVAPALSLDNELVNSVPNLANATNSREAFVTATSWAASRTSPVACGTSGAGAFGPSASIGGPTGVPSQSLGNVGIACGLTGFVQTIIQPGVTVEVPMANAEQIDSDMPGSRLGVQANRVGLTGPTPGSEWAPTSPASPPRPTSRPRR